MIWIQVGVIVFFYWSFLLFLILKSRKKNKEWEEERKKWKKEREERNKEWEEIIKERNRK